MKILETADFAETTKIYEIKGKLNEILERLAPEEKEKYLNITGSLKPTRAQLTNLKLKTRLENKIKRFKTLLILNLMIHMILTLFEIKSV